MDESGGCSVCQKKPAKVCECNGEAFCDRHLAKHMKTEGQHKVTAPEEVKVSIHERSASLIEKQVPNEKSHRRHSEVDRKQSSRKINGDSDHKAPVVKRVLTKADYIQMLQMEIAKVQRFKESTTDAIAAMAETLITQIVSEAKVLINDITNICGQTEAPLVVALRILQDLPEEETKIPMNNPVLVRLYEAKDEVGYEMLKFKAEIREISLDFKSIATYSAEWAPVGSMVELRGYFEAHKGDMHLNLQRLFDTILAEQHYTTESITLSKSNLSEHGGAEHAAIALPYFTQVKELKLGGNNLGADEVRILFPIIGTMVGLTKLHLQKNDLKASGGRELSLVLGNLSKLRDLDLSGNNLGAEGIRHIAGVVKKLPNLKQLHLQDNNLGSESAKHLAGGLRQLKGLKTVHLEGNSFTTEDIRTINNSNASGCKISFNKT